MINEKVVLHITCDNPDCPGTDLDPSNRTGWMFISHEVYGQTSGQSVFCSSACVSAAAGAAEDSPNEVFLSQEETQVPAGPPPEPTQLPAEPPPTPEQPEEEPTQPVEEEEQAQPEEVEQPTRR